MVLLLPGGLGAVKPHSRALAAVGSLNRTGSFLFGVVSDTGSHYDDLWGRGLRAATLELQWKKYEPQPGVYDQNYVNHLKQVLAQLNAQGWSVQLVPGFHYAPDWVYTNFPQYRYVNQFGEAYTPDPLSAGDFRVINAPFNPEARALIAGYLGRIFQDFNQSDPAYRFYSVRIGGGVQGELRYPPGDWNGHTNAYWAFDGAAQNSAVSGIPAAVTGWRPGLDANPGSLNRGQLLVNAGFEVAHSYFATPGWSPDDEIIAEVLAAGAHSGNGALKITLSSANRLHQTVRVAPNTRYYFGGWLKTANAARRARMFATQYNAAWQPVAGAAFTKLETTSLAWASLSGSILTGPATTLLKIELDGDQPGTYSFDDVWLQKDGETNTQGRSIDIPGAFYDWYVQKLIDFQNWQIAEVRKSFAGQLDIVVAGKGARQNQITGALVNDLRGDGWSEAGSALYAGADYERIFAGLTVSQPMAIYLTGIEDPAPNVGGANAVDDHSPYPSRWSSSRWLAYLSRRYGIMIWGENTGRNTQAEMQLTFERMRANGFMGLLWGFESNLYASPNPAGYASAGQYQALIEMYSNLQKMYLPFTIQGH